jgi:hypothetical protein
VNSAAAPRALWLKGEFAPEEKPQSQPVDAPERTAPDSPLCCVQCGHPITHDRYRTTVDGRHAHTRMNPYGFVFHFGCFSQAEGCFVEGPPTTEDSWFAGYAWEFANCAACQAHLGWAFHGEGSFFALILERLCPPN